VLAMVVGRSNVVYELRWGSPVGNGKYKACRGLDLALTFDNIAL
jgi:hypothetical protein